MKSRLERKVGLFILAGLVLTGLLLMQFSKGMNLFRPTYDILLESVDVAGLKERAAVLMSGVQIGSVKSMELANGGKHVVVTLRLYKAYPVHKDARFLIQQSGFLGDQYIGVIPGENKAPLFQDQDQAKAEPPFNLQEVARSAGGFVQKIEEIAIKLDETLVLVRSNLLNEATLTDLSLTVTNLRSVSEEALAAVGNLNSLVKTNSPAIAQSSSNLIVFSKQLNTFGDRLNLLLETNSPNVHAAVRNVEDSTAILKTMMEDVQSGKGLAGTMLRDEKVAADVSNITANLSITSSNLNRLGLWGILWKKKTAQEPAPAPENVLRSPKDQRPVQK